MQGGEIFVPKLPSYKIMDLAKSISPKSKIKFIGIKTGEKLHEEMISVNDALNTLEFKDHFVILPDSKYSTKSRKKYLNRNKKIKFCKEGFSYSSDKNNIFLSLKELKKLIF